MTSLHGSCPRQVSSTATSTTMSWSPTGEDRRTRVLLTMLGELIRMDQLIMAMMLIIPTGEDRRTRTSPTLRTAWGHLVTSATTTMSTPIPTGAFVRQTISNFIQKYWWLRSPHTYYGVVWAVRSGGNLENYDVDYDSYGCISSHRIHLCITIIRLSM